MEYYKIGERGALYVLGWFCVAGTKKMNIEHRTSNIERRMAKYDIQICGLEEKL